MAVRAGDLADADERPEGWLERYYGEAGLPIGLPLNSTSSQFESVRVVKAGAGALFGFSGFNNGPGQFVLIFDSSAPPAAGAVPETLLIVPAAANFSYDAGAHGRVFHRGIVLANSTTAATLTAGLANCWFDAQYV